MTVSLWSASPLFGQDDHTILIVFDASSRMAGEVRDQTKMQHAIHFVEDLVDANIPARLGLTVFGSDDASGSEAYFSPVPPGRGTGPAIIEELNRLQSAGMSPMASALVYGSQSLNVIDINYIILITDGFENTGGGPVSVTESLLNRGVVSRLDVVGFVDNVEENRLLAELAISGEGLYVPAWNSDELIQDYRLRITETIENSRNGMVGYRCFIGSVNSFPAYGITTELRNSANQIIDTRNFWRGIFENLEAGSYTLIARINEITRSAPVEVVPGERSDHNFVFDFATGGFTFRHLIQNTIDGKAYGVITRVYHSSGEIIYTGTSWAGEINNLPEGNYQVEAYFEGLPQQTQEIMVQEGTKPVTTFQFDVGRGRISYQCFLDQSQTNVANGTTIKMYRQPYNELVLEQEQWRGTTPYLPVGLYSVEGNYKGTIREEYVEIHSDSTSTLTLLFNIVQVRFTYQCFRNEIRKTPATGVAFQIFNQRGELVEESNFWRGTFQLPEGVYSLKAQYQGITKVQTLNLFSSSQAIVAVFDFEL